LKRELLYCHCIATAEPMDPNYVYRDKLLWELLSMEHHNSHIQQINANDQDNYFVEEGELQLPRRESNRDRYYPLRFSYQSLLEDKELNRIAKEVISSLNLDPTSDTVSAARTAFTTKSYMATQQQVNQLVRNTVRALRQDGILYLVDPTKDIYMLMSKWNVLGPYIQQSLQCRDHFERTKFHSQRPDFLQHVPSARLQLVKRMVLQELQQQQSDTARGEDDDDSDMGDGDRILLPQTQGL
jgi:hypothetical protein